MPERKRYVGKPESLYRGRPYGDARDEQECCLLPPEKELFQGFDDWLEGKPEDGAQEVFEEEVEDPLADDRYLDGDLEREQAEKKQEETQAQPKKDLSQMSTEELMKEFMEAWEKSSDQPTKKPKCL